MITKQGLDQLTVLQLRKYAKDNRVKLEAGINKDGIVRKICESCGIPYKKTDESVHQTFFDMMNPAEKANASEPVKPARRGRPPKAAQIAGLDISAKPESTAEPKKPLKRGRPPKTTQIAELDFPVEPESIAEPKKPVKRGRPPKNAIKADVLPSESLGSTGEPTEFSETPEAAASTPPLNIPSALLPNSSLSFDVTSYAKKAGPMPRQEKPATPPAAQNTPAKPPLGNKPPIRPMPGIGGLKRFGPKSRMAEPENPSPTVEKEETPVRETRESQLVTTDGYRLGYRAAPVRGGYQGKGDSATHSRYAYPRAPLTIAPAENHFHDDIYQTARNVEFDKQVQEGVLPELLQCADGLTVKGNLEIEADGYGFLRANEEKIYVSPAQIKRYGLRCDDIIEGKALKVKREDPYPALLYVEKLNDKDLQSSDAKMAFEQLDAEYPNRKISMDIVNPKDPFTRLADLVAPIGFGQRGLIIAPPDSGELIVLRNMARSISESDPDAEIFILLIDVPPEEITETRKLENTEVFASSFADPPETQTRISEALLERAQRAASDGKNAVILLSSLNKLVRAYQNQIAQGNRPITNAVTPSALIRPKRLFGMAKNTKEAGSLTVIAVLQVETGSRIDDIIYEEFKGTANMVLVLLAPKPDDPMFPMMDLEKTGTRREDLLLSPEEKEGLKLVHTILMGESNNSSIAQLIDMAKKTRTNKELLLKFPGWVAIFDRK